MDGQMNMLGLPPMAEWRHNTAETKIHFVFAHQPV
jgi:hypothetical protein